ncbi:MAG TPA: NAD(P)/FAD-dependent oxidoreductase [Candidatus Acidoferrales bacterium]|nr:NAD(P)/FAD-dependent oxidoreductase [Candidatus Acidoferrales bacterium]
MNVRRTRVAVIGAGAAGLAAARSLHERHIDFLLLEARDRAGGRAHTLPSWDGSFPIELGAEFIHGLARPTRAIMREIGEEMIPTVSRSDDMWEVADRVLGRVDIGGRDQSVASFLDSPATQFSAEERNLTSWIVEGFDAALLDDASVIGIAKEWRSGVNDSSHRPANGYAPIVAHLAQLAGDALLLDTRVTHVEWSSQGVAVGAVSSGEPLRIEARRAIVTLPVGVLRAEPALFSPALPERKRKAIDALAMGPVLKVMLEFRSEFWEPQTSFLRAPEAPMRAVWTRLPQRVPLLGAWSGGGAVQRVHERYTDPVHAALDTAAALFPSIDVRAQLRNAYFHDWQADPFARGAYSYLRVGGGDARAGLAEPLDDVLFFAGEAASTDDAGTVAGALATGYESARSIAK